MKLHDDMPHIPRGSLGQRLEDARLLLSVHGYLRESESDRICKKLEADWQTEEAARAAFRAIPALRG